MRQDASTKTKMTTVLQRTLFKLPLALEIYLKPWMVEELRYRSRVFLHGFMLRTYIWQAVKVRIGFEIFFGATFACPVLEVYTMNAQFFWLNMRGAIHHGRGFRGKTMLP